MPAVKVNVAGVKVEAFMEFENVAVSVVSLATPVALLAGVTEVTDGRIGVEITGGGGGGGGGGGAVTVVKPHV